MSNQNQQHWAETDWFKEVSSWIHAQLEQQAIQINGQIEQLQVRPWSTVLQVPTTNGDIFFKATMATFAYEGALTQLLSQSYPGNIPQVLAIDSSRHWLLMRDSGVPMRQLIQSGKSIEPWLNVLPLYAKMQIELSNRVSELVALGVPDRRLNDLPAQYKQLLADTEALLIGQSEGLTPEAYQQLQTRLPQVTKMCQQLADYRIPESLHHDDFHDANIFVKDNQYTFADWGECCIGHPFFTLVIILRSAAYQLDLSEESPELLRLRDAYLEPWLVYESQENLLTAFKLAHQLGMLCRCLTWYQLVSTLEGPTKDEYAEAVPGWLDEFLEGKLVSD